MLYIWNLLTVLNLSNRQIHGHVVPLWLVQYFMGCCEGIISWTSDIYGSWTYTFLWNRACYFITGNVTVSIAQCPSDTLVIANRTQKLKWTDPVFTGANGTVDSNLQNGGKFALIFFLFQMDCTYVPLSLFKVRVSKSQLRFLVLRMLKTLTATPSYSI